MRYRALVAAVPIAALLAATAALSPAASASSMSTAPAAARPAADTVTWLYRVEADWVRMHTRPSASSTTKALARKWDGSGVVAQRAPQSNGFTLFTDRQNGVTGWVLTSYIEELLCIDGDCE
jgi:hypothetical protein